MRLEVPVLQITAHYGEGKLNYKLADDSVETIEFQGNGMTCLPIEFSLALLIRELYDRVQTLEARLDSLDIQLSPKDNL